MMDPKDMVKGYSWKPWLERPFGAFMLSLFEGSTSEEAHGVFGLEVSLPLVFFQWGKWYQSEEVNLAYAKELERIDALPKIFSLSEQLERFRVSALAEIPALSGTLPSRLSRFHELLLPFATAIWFTHGLEDAFRLRLSREGVRYEEVAPYLIPSRKTSTVLMEEELASGLSPAEAASRYGWLRLRNAFSDFYTEEDMRVLIPDKKKEPLTLPSPPAAHADLVRIGRELVYFRTARTDGFYQLLSVARSLLMEAASAAGCAFLELAHYPLGTLIDGSYEKVPSPLSFAMTPEALSFSTRPLVPLSSVDADEVHGQVSFRGKVRGRVKVVRFAEETSKVEEGDILVAQMTFPGYLPAMRKAAAFVTDEGGITCHASIIAREMKKPCIVGTEIATQVFSDGDLVLVDAEKGIVRKVV